MPTSGVTIKLEKINYARQSVVNSLLLVPNANTKLTIPKVEMLCNTEI